MSPLVLFDLDNTLLDRETAFERWACAFCHARGLPDSAVGLLVAADDDGFNSRDEVFDRFRARHPVEEPNETLIAAYHDEYPRFFEFPDESRSALRRLRRAGWKVGIVTNGWRFQHRKIEVVRLHEEVDAVCVSDSIDSWKPDPFIFEEAARRCGSQLSGWMVGDSGPADIRGGQGVGLSTVWIHRNRVWELGEPGPDAQVATVSEAVSLILGGTLPA